MRNYILPLVFLSLAGLCLSVEARGSDNSNPERTSVTPDVYQPLRPANTASPRDTLRSFQEDYGLVVAELMESGMLTTRTGLAAFDRAVHTLNFSTTRNGSARSVQAQRLIYLKEILDRLDLPPDEAIPGPVEVREEGLSSWTIPNTRMRLEREETGSYAGEWRFSPRTVERLPRYFRQIRVLPYQPGAAEGLYDTVRQKAQGMINLESELNYRLRAASMDSPRETLESFLINMNLAYTLMMEADAALRSDRASLSKEAIEDYERRINDNLQRAVTTLELSKTPEAIRYDVGLETAMQMKEIFDRVGLPPIEHIPDIEAVEAWRRDTAHEKQPLTWTFPNTDLQIVAVTEGSNAGRFQFSARTVEIAASSYYQVKDLPYRPSSDVYYHFTSKYESPNISPGFYEFYVTTPGNMIPQATPLGRIVDQLPDGFHTIVWEQTIWQWISLIIVYLLTIVASILIFLFNGQLFAWFPGTFSHWSRIVPPLLAAILFDWATDYSTDQINITGALVFGIINFDGAVRAALVAWVVFCACRAVAETLIALPQIKEESIDAGLLRLSSRIIGTLLSLWVLLTALQNLGLDILPIIAGLGVGGLAVALAFRPTMENVIGSFMIFADKPYKVGQRIKVLGADGTVESIGLRSTKIRLLTGHLTTIPNEKMATVEIENIGQRPYIRRVFDVTVTYDTKPKQINRAVEIIREILSVPEEEREKSQAVAEDDNTHPNVSINQPDFPPRVFFNSLNADSLNILVIYWFHPAHYWEFLEHGNWVNVQIMERFNAEGIDFAFPTQTLHLAGDPKRKLSISNQWESDDDGQSPINLFSQAAAFGAQSALGHVSFASASDEIRPAHRPVESEPNASGDTSEAPIEDEIADSDGESER